MTDAVIQKCDKNKAMAKRQYDYELNPIYVIHEITKNKQIKRSLCMPVVKSLLMWPTKLPRFSYIRKFSGPKSLNESPEEADGIWNFSKIKRYQFFLFI